MPCIVKRTSPAKSVKKKKNIQNSFSKSLVLEYIQKFADKDVNSKRQEIISQG